MVKLKFTWTKSSQFNLNILLMRKQAPRINGKIYIFVMKYLDLDHANVNMIAKFRILHKNRNTKL